MTDTSPVFSERARQLDDYVAQLSPNAGNMTNRAEDSFRSAVMNNGSLENTMIIKHGRVQLPMPYANWYRVALDEMYGVLPCCALTTGAGPGLIGPRDTSTYPAGTRVYVLLHRSGLWGYVIGAAPDLVEDGNDLFSDNVVQGSGVGICRSGYYRDYMDLLNDEGGVIDFSNHRPLDSLSFDWGKMAETGLGIHIDPMMTFLRADEVTGLWMFYSSQLARLAGHNLEIQSGGHEESYRDDEGELALFRGEALYPHELLGCFSPDTPSSRTNEDKDVIHNLSEGKFEPVAADQQPFYRWQEHGGYLGQGKMRLMALPPTGKLGGSFLNRYSDESPPLGVFREHIAPDGSYSLASAKRVVIAKRSLLSVPKRIRPVDDYSERADSAEAGNYDFSGGLYSGSITHLVGDLDVVGEMPQLLTAAAVMDLHAYMFNWTSLHAFSYHEGDFALANESEIEGGATQVQFIPPFSELATKMWLDRPEAKKQAVDHRYGEVDYFEVSQHITMQDDGALVIQGGQGEEIRMVGGSIEMSAPGNIYLRPGGSIVLLGGDDVILRANKSVDISASHNDVRLKAEQNLQIMAANGGTGVTLIENRATNREHEYPTKGGEAIAGSGVIIKAPNSQFASLSGEVYLRTGNPEGRVEMGQITLDANRGLSGGSSGNIRMVANSIYRSVTSEIRDGFGIGSPTKINKCDLSDNLFGGVTRVDGAFMAEGPGLFRDGVTSVDGEFLSAGGAHVSKLDNRGVFDTLLKKIKSDVEKSKIAHYQDYLTSIIQWFHEYPKIGSDQKQKEISFGARSEKEYGTADFKLAQSHWQILNNVDSAGEAWEEPDIKYQGDQVGQPWPGKEKWEDSTRFLQLPADRFSMYDLANGQAKDRPGDYSDKAYKGFDFRSAKEGYFVIPKETEE